jgi:hypothetical protein
MSRFIKTQRIEDEPIVSYKCVANGCPLSGGISTILDKWTCSFHFRSEPDKWPMVTEAIRESRDILGLIDGLRKIDEISWVKDTSSKDAMRPAQITLYQQLFDDRPELKPMDNEKRVHYEYRLFEYVSMIAGVLTKKHEASYPKAYVPKTWTNAADAF